MRKLLIAIQEQLYAAQTWLFRLVLKAPFDVGLDLGQGCLLWCDITGRSGFVDV